jgi:hypothetical protein
MKLACQLRFGRSSASLADHAVDGFGRLGSDGEPLVSDREIDGEVGAFEKWIVSAELFDETTVAALAAVHSNDFVIRAVFGALAVESERYRHKIKLPFAFARESGGRGKCKVPHVLPSRILMK